VYGGIEAAPATPGETAVQVNSHFIILERVRDPALEAEATAAYPSPLTVAFELSPRAWTCLQDLQTSVEGATSALQTAGITVVTNGPSPPYDAVSVTACTPVAKRSVTDWFAERYGDAVRVTTCAQIPTSL
jgi:hypothetical protein